MRRSANDARPSKSFSTLPGFFEALLLPELGTKMVHCKFKVTGIDTVQSSAAGPSYRTNVLLELLLESSSPKNKLEQINAKLTCVWNQTRRDSSTDASSVLKLKSLACQKLELIESVRGNEKLFEDVTITAMGHHAFFEQQVLHGVDYWSQRLTGVDDMRTFGHHGVAVGDVNGDLLDDVYVCDAGGLPNRLLVQQPDGSVKDTASQAGVDWFESTSAALLVDLDNDGDQDLVVATVAGILIAANDGRGKFSIRTAEQGVADPHSICAADFDNDGALDLFVCNYGPSKSASGERGFESAAPIPYHDANNGGANILLKNLGGFRFRNVTKSVGLDQNNRRFSFAAAWEDYDSDGDLDLYVANDFGRNNLYRNTAGRFEDIAAVAGVEDMAGGMSVDWADVNRDGRPDIYIGNMFSAAGNRVTFQRRFYQRRSTDEVTGIRRMARGNTLFTARPDGSFDDASESADVTMGRWAWSSKLPDLNNDGWPDICVANGYFTNQNADDL